MRWVLARGLESYGRRWSARWPSPTSLNRWGESARVHDLDWHVITEIKVEMMRLELERLHQTGEVQRFTVAELADRTGMNVDQIGRRFRV